MNEEILVPLFALIFAIGMPLSIPIIKIVLNYRKRRQLVQLHHTERMAAIERGMEVPPLPIELIDERTPRRRRTSLLPGLVWFFVGISVLISMNSLAEEEALLGLIPTGIGLAYLVYYFVEGRKLEARFMESDLRAAEASRSKDSESLR